jgi:tryptophan-rich sensory protein
MDWIVFIVFFAACIAAGSTGAMFSPGEWYEKLSKPSWTPPNWVFPVTWSVLYILMAWSAWRVATIDGNALAMAFWALQIALNTLWTPVFFGLRKMRAAMIVISALWVSVAATALAFWQLDPVSGLMLVPYLVWVTIAAALNFSVWRRNPQLQPVPAAG